MKIITYNHNKSTGVGGIQTLIRNLQDIAGSINTGAVEIYHDLYGSEYFQARPNVEYHKISRWKITPWKIGSAIKRLRTYHRLLKMQPGEEDWLIVFQPTSLFFIPRSVARSTRIILVQSNKLEFLYSSSVARLAMLLKGRHIDIHTVYTEMDKSKLRRLFPSFNDRIAVIPRGCKLATGKATASCSKRLVTIARLEERQKNFKAMVDIFHLLPAGYTLDIYGDGDPNEIGALIKLVADHPSIRFRGPVKEVDAVLRQHAVFIMTSHYEGFGQTLIEARSQGLPIVAFDTFDALPWIVQNGRNGFTVSPGDLAGFAERIQSLTTDADLYERFSQSALLLARETEASIINRQWQNLLLNCEQSMIGSPTAPEPHRHSAAS
ncbi:Glycosyltransferase involved in cell wall bisynthesis [Halopseudomonas litoralis]|uniref:Glycosyltransferase involved in cell wall bisynthesis n=1 Tax=Halopseudomonas litoralis TaxID=797277 RepID=A0A1H1P5S6_9GAMM|nr:glycosyltransferase [Halopseudomonas litoralis]SDS06390.1 Glycosyltransferase involved in cell wall bisynthesis [Halopseudomonas litoralis]